MLKQLTSNSPKTQKSQMHYQKSEQDLEDILESVLDEDPSLFFGSPPKHARQSIKTS